MSAIPDFHRPPDYGAAPPNPKTKEPWEGDWASEGFFRAPVTVAQHDFALTSREWVRKLKCYDDIYRMLGAEGRAVADVAWYVDVVQKEGFREDGKKISVSSLKKYLQIFRYFFIPAHEVVTAPISPRVLEELPADVRQKRDAIIEAVMTVEPVIRETSILEEAINIQMQRIKRAVAMEEKMDGLLMPNMYKELDTLKGLVEASQGMKSDLGMPGYQRVPIGVDFTHKFGKGTNFEAMSPPEKKLLSAFGAELIGIIHGKTAAAAESTVEPSDEEAIESIALEVSD